jgi:hypothetical protein
MKQLTFILAILWVLGVHAQNSIDSRFIQHLVNKGDYSEVVFLLDREAFDISRSKTDSLYYLKGWALYSLKELEPSAIALLNVSESSPFYYKSRFFAGYNHAYLANYPKATSVFGGLGEGNLMFSNLRELQLSGIDLLNSNYQQAAFRLSMIDSTLSPLHEPLMNLKLINLEMQKHNAKSPFVAALLSAVIPGAGKFYAGRKGQAVSSFISTVGFGLIAWENYRKLGLTNAKTIIFGAAFAGNYASTIYGSAKAVKVNENDYKNVMHQQVLFNLHIPLRNIFE